MERLYCEKLSITGQREDSACALFEVDENWFEYTLNHRIPKKYMKGRQCWMCEHATEPEECKALVKA